MTTELDVKKQESLPPQDIGSINDLTPSPETLYSLGEYLKKRFQEIRNFRERSDWEVEKAKAFKSYHMHPKQRELPFPGAANMSSPFSRIGVDSFHANVMASMFSDGNRMTVSPVIIQKDYASTARKASDYMTYVLNHEADIYNVLDDADKKAQMYGVGYLEPHYIKEEIWETVEVTKKTKVPVQDSFTGEITYKDKTDKKTERRKRTVFDGTKIDSIPVESIYTTPFLKDLEQAVREDAVFKLFISNWGDIREKSKKREGKTPFYIESQVQRIRPFIVEKAVKVMSELEQARAKQDGSYMDMYCQKEQVEMAQGYLWYDIDNDGTKEEISAVFHPVSGAVVRVSLTPCRIVDIVPRPIDGRREGEGIPKVCEHLDSEWEVLHNTRCNAGMWENMPFGFYRAGGSFNPKQITLRPLHMYPVTDPREVVFPQTQRVGSSYFQEEANLFNIFERILALDENFQGVSSRRSRSATETLNVSQRSSIRFGNPFNRIVNQVNKLLDHIWDLNRECAPEDKEYFVAGTDGAPIFQKMDRYSLNANLKFAVSVNSVFDQQNSRDTMLMAYRLFVVNPIVQQHPEVIWDLSQKTLDELGVNVDLPKPPQANTLTPFEEHELFQKGESPEPGVGEDVEHHLKTHMLQMNSEDIKNWEPEAVQRLVLHISKTQILKQTLDSANLNKSGMFNGQGMAPQPSVTSNRNPTQMFNTMKVGESGKSQAQNLRNGNGPTNAEATINSVLNQPIS